MIPEAILKIKNNKFWLNLIRLDSLAQNASERWKIGRTHAHISGRRIDTRAARKVGDQRASVHWYTLAVRLLARIRSARVGLTG